MRPWSFSWSSTRCLLTDVGSSRPFTLTLTLTQNSGAPEDWSGVCTYRPRQRPGVRPFYSADRRRARAPDRLVRQGTWGGGEQRVGALKLEVLQERLSAPRIPVETCRFCGSSLITLFRHHFAILDLLDVINRSIWHRLWLCRGGGEIQFLLTIDKCWVKGT